MGGALFCPEWRHEDEVRARPLSRARKEKLLALCYRVRKDMGWRQRELFEIPDEFRTHLPQDLQCAIFHTESIPESIDSIRISGARFTLSGSSSSVPLSTNHHAVVLASPRVPAEAPASFHNIAPVTLGFHFSTSQFSSNKTLVPIELKVTVADSDSDGISRVSVLYAFAESPAFQHDVHAEYPGRWWNRKEHTRGNCREPLNAFAESRSGEFADYIIKGSAVLDLSKCRMGHRPSVPPFWNMNSATTASSKAIWAFLTGRAAADHPWFNRARCCPDVCKIIADFTLEHMDYEFEVDISFGLAVSNF